MGSLVSAMAFKELIFMAMVGVSMLACPNRDCSCADKSFGECNVPTTVANEVHTESRELCIANCELFHSIGGCDWILYKGTTTKTNCLMFTNDFEDMTEYLESCNLTLHVLTPPSAQIPASLARQMIPVSATTRQTALSTPSLRQRFLQLKTLMHADLHAFWTLPVTQTLRMEASTTRKRLACATIAATGTVSSKPSSSESLKQTSHHVRPDTLNKQ